MSHTQTSLKVLTLLMGALLVAATTCGRHSANNARYSDITQTPPAASLSKAASQIPANVRLVARDAGIALSAGGYTLSWKYENPGDYSQDGKVAIEDITPLAQQFNGDVPAYDLTLRNTIQAVIDGSGNGKLGIEDVTPLAMNWASEVTGYRIDGAESTNGPWNEIASLTVDDGDESEGRLAFSNEIAPGFIYYRIVTLTPNGDAAYSNILIAPSNEPVIYSVSPTSAFQHEEYTFTATASGQEPLTYAWDFGGGATPNTSSDISPTVTLSGAGDYSCTLTISNSYGPTTFPFTLTISARDMWVHTWKGLGWSDGWGLLTDDSNLYVVGGDNEDALILKYSQGGDLIWAREFGVDGIEDIIGCAFDEEGNIIAGGESYALGEGSWDLMLLKYSPNGDLLRAMTWGTSDYENSCIKGFATDSQGNIYQCGEWSQYGGDPKALIVKYDADWNVLWAKLWGGTEYNFAVGVQAVNGAVYVCGEIGHWTSPEHDALVLKLDENGDVLWARRWGTERSDDFFGVVAGQNGSVYLFGNSYHYGEDNYGIVAEYNEDGDYIGAKGWDADGFSQFSDICLNPAGGLTVTGIITQRAILALQLDECLSFLEAHSWLGEPLGQRVNSCAYDNDGDLYLTGDGTTATGTWTEQSDLTYELAGSSSEAVGSVYDLQGTSNEVTGTETTPEGTIDSVTDYQLLFMKNFPR